MTTMRRFLAMMLACALMTTLCAQGLAESMTVYAARDDAKVYDASGTAVGAIALNTKLTLTGVKGNVCQVRLGDRTGYMKKKDLSTGKVAEKAEAAQSAPQTSVTAYARDGAKVYDAGGASLGALEANTTVTVTAVKGGVCRVSAGGRTAYMKKKDLSESPVAVAPPTPAPAMAAKTLYAKANAVIYNASGKALAPVAANTEITCIAVKGNICQVSVQNKTCYMKKKDLSESPVAEATPTPTPTVAPQSVSASAYAAKEGAKVYNASGSAVGALSLNAQVTVTAVKGNICQVKADGHTGYMKKADLSASKVETSETLDQSCFVAKDGAKVYSASGSVIATLPLNTALTVVRTNGKLCQVKADGHTGYMKAEDLSCDRTETPSSVVDIPDTTGYVNKQDAKVYDADGSTIATLSLNAAVTVSAYSDTLVRVVNGSTIGYMSKADISQEKTQANYTLKQGDSGEAVKRVQSRLKDLGYFAGAVGGNYQALTQSAVAVFQAQAGLSADGVCDVKTLEVLFSDSAPKMAQTPDNGADTSNGPTSSNSTATPAHGTAREMDWWTSGIQSIFARGTTAVITDVATGLAWREQRRGGTNHADVQPLTAADTAVLKKAYGGTWSWNRRAIFVTINGVNYAASMNGMPHGGGSISGNNFNGHHCIHFTNSRTHGSNKVCSLHQSAIKKALAVTL